MLDQSGGAEPRHDENVPVLKLRLRLGEQILSIFSTSASFGHVNDIALRGLSVEYLFPSDAGTEAFFRQAAMPQ